jgi:hypothetical protein
MAENQKTYCYNCERETNQETLFYDSELGPQEIIGRNDEGDESQSMWAVVANIFTLSKCLGCDKINFKNIIRSSPNRETDNVFHFPKKAVRSIPNWIIKLPIKYFELIQEIYSSINQGSYILSLIGIRTLLDVYIVKNVGDIGSFKQKLNQLVANGVLTQKKVLSLETAIDAGNASAHRGYKPDKETLFQILDIVENLLHSEIVDRPIDQIKQKTPPRDKNKQ